MYCSCAAQRTLKLQTTDLGAEALVLAGAGREAGPLGGAAPAHRVDGGPQDSEAVLEARLESFGVMLRLVYRSDAVRERNATVSCYRILIATTRDEDFVSDLEVLSDDLVEDADSALRAVEIVPEVRTVNEERADVVVEIRLRSALYQTSGALTSGTPTHAVPMFILLIFEHIFR